MIDKEEVLARLSPEAVASTYGIVGRWSGRWLRSRQCPAGVHGTDAFGLSREGKWHCHACDIGGGDLLSLVAAFEKTDCTIDFPRVVEVAATIAGVEDDDAWGGPSEKRAPRKLQAPVQAPIADRLHVARARCEWVWAHLKSPDRVERVQATGRHAFLDTRGLPWGEIPEHARVNVRDLGFWTMPGSYDELVTIMGEDHVPKEERRGCRAVRAIYNAVGVGVAVRHVETGHIVDIRARRSEVAEGEPKILGMLGGVTVDNGELVACYGNPHALDRDVVVVVEGWADYLTACWRWPKLDVLGAVDAGQYPLVAGFAARYLAERGQGHLVLVAQDDRREVVDPDTWETKIVTGAAERAVAAASKRAIALMGPTDVVWLECSRWGAHDLNDIAKAGRAGELPGEP